jgi:hypothetical protein
MTDARSKEQGDAGQLDLLILPRSQGAQCNLRCDLTHCRYAEMLINTMFRGEQATMALLKGPELGNSVSHANSALV